MKNHSSEESDDLDEPTTDSISFEAQVPTKKKGSNIDYKYNQQWWKIFIELSSSSLIHIRICKQIFILILD